MGNLFLFLLALFLLALLSSPVYAGVFDETRCCTIPARNANGEIIRRADVLRAFKKIHPCPSTGLTSGACPGWSVDHTWPLAVCGLDSVGNMAWMPNAIKSAAGKLPKDRWERRIYKCPGEAIELTPMP